MSDTTEIETASPIRQISAFAEDESRESITR